MKLDVVKVCAGLIIILAVLMCQGMATETTWRFSGFELYGYDINFTSHNATNVKNIDAENITSQQIGGVIYADQYATIQDAINASDTNSDNIADYEVYVPSGTYNSDSITLISNLTLRGAGITSHIILNTGIDDSLLLADGCDNIRIEYLHLDGNKAGQSAKSTRDFQNSNILVFSNNIVRNWEDSMIFSNITTLWIENNYNIDSDGDGFFVMDFSENIHINYNKIINSYDDGIAVGQAGVTTNPRTEHMEIIGNIINRSNACVGSSIRVHSHIQDAIISNNIIVASNSTSGDGIEYRRYSPDPGKPSRALITNNIVKNFARDGIKVSNVSDGTIVSDNLVSNVGRDSGHGIWLDKSNNTIITNNYIENTAIGIRLYGDIVGDPGNHYTLISSNIVENTVHAIYVRYNNTKNIIKDNILNGSTSIIYSTDSDSDNYIYNNYGINPFNFGSNATAPTPFGEGDEYFNTTDNIKYCYNGSAWHALY